MDKNFDKNFGWPFEENSRATISCVPKHLVNTPLLRDRYFFTLPKMLLDEISKEVGKSDGKHPKHLKEWMQIVRCGNTARNRLDSLVRRLELQHYWRVFCVRHADVVTGNINRLEKAFATFLRAKQSAVHADLVAIRRSLGHDWIHRGVLPVPPNTCDEG